ncbi:Vitamin B12 import ATP-binding protein BtuD [Apilactobacillus kunkeei]|uniref:XRE family transcriptional regulator n=1 Tax=Apilactobacillus kunkeei TaxID=148814 RepID=UPI00110CEB1D|nr:XRE family transcriptional regulator [Apilactobacillus kunkeei]MCK8619806.1 XRE family transcriptional regulator [Apilactobacillus kunkeei]TMT02806.1 XRE family transcriptional regulator [Apilactobacillus kunkeei]CAI2668544.1 Vitamin B12 import ATP-binding protein BtuD [Apilactobacillus kunkeei]CAI2671797.1 Vitamin B12 import ATP-binding protein BtuD [Apilactobacillus kunkeei]CAI2673146.1 Vitamin B12 import ATP-binding protein BtuD [Apilactobacillus kunkeei]
MEKNIFSSKLIGLRRKNQLSQAALANKLFVTRQSISKWENGESEPSIDKLISISEIFNTSLDNLIMGNKSDKDKLVSINHLNKSYDNQVLNDLSLDIYDNERIALLGLNGSGKTTMISIMTGLKKADSGNVKFNFNKKKGLKLMPQNDVLINDMKVIELIKLTQLLNKVKNNNHVESLVKEFNFSELMDHYVGSLSGGQKRRLSLLLSLMAPSKLLVLDEPTVGMDLETIDILWNHLEHVTGSILMVTHDFNQIDKFFSRVLLLKDGKIESDMNVDKIHSHNQNVEQWYRANNGGLNHD